MLGYSFRISFSALCGRSCRCTRPCLATKGLSRQKCVYLQWWDTSPLAGAPAKLCDYQYKDVLALACARRWSSRCRVEWKQCVVPRIPEFAQGSMFPPHKVSWRLGEISRLDRYSADMPCEMGQYHVVTDSASPSMIPLCCAACGMWQAGGM